jgi:RecA/RadA recombinase
MDDNALVIYFESESALTKKMLQGRGLDLRRLIILPVSTVEEFRTQCIKVANQYIADGKAFPMMIVLDSLGNLSTTKEMEDTEKGEGTRDMTRTQVIKGTFRVLSLKLGSAGIPLIITNHTYDAIGSYIPTKVMSGGSGLRYAASIILTLSKVKDKEEDEVTGAIITITTFKSRLTRENSKVKACLKFSGGLDRYYGLMEMAVKAGLVKKVSTRYEFPDGTKVFEKHVNKEPEKYWTPELLLELDKYVQKAFLYGNEYELTDETLIVTNEEANYEHD